LQVLHRLVAWGLLGLALANVAAARGRLSVVAWAAAVTVTVQGAIGVANVLLRLPVEVTLLHTAGAAAVVVSTVSLARATWAAPLVRRLPSAAASAGPPAAASADEGAVQGVATRP
jgi:heme A synthase